MKTALIFELFTLLIFCAWAQTASAHQYAYEAKILSIYDGDTVTAEIMLGMGSYRIEKLRLNRIDAPEVRGKERPRGKESRDMLRRLIQGARVTVLTIKDKKGKYGRYLAEIIFNGKNVNDWLVESGLAVYKEY